MLTFARPGVASYGRHELLPSPIRELDLGSVKHRLLKEGRTLGRTPAQVDLVEEEYRKFLSLCLLHPAEDIIPDGPIDTFWHAHIGDTQKYADDCQSIFGRFLHRFPHHGDGSGAERVALIDAFEETRTKYRASFGEPPEALWLAAALCDDGGGWMSGG